MHEKYIFEAAVNFLDAQPSRYERLLMEMARAKKAPKTYTVAQVAQLSNASLGQLQKRMDAVGAAARTERAKRLREAANHPKISQAMQTLKGHLKGQAVSPEQLAQMAQAMRKASKRTV